MRGRNKILNSLESAYRTEFERAETVSDMERMSKLDFEFQRDQVLLEVLLDVREALDELVNASESPDQPKKSLLERAQDIRKLTRLR